MGKPENQFIASVHRHLAPREPHWEKMHNEYRGGTADVWYSGFKSDLWIEYKFLPRIPQRGVIRLCKTDIKNPILSILQQNWLHERYEEGRAVYVIVGCPSGGVVLRDLEWMHEIPVAAFVKRMETRKSLANWITQQTVR